MTAMPSPGAKTDQSACLRMCGAENVRSPGKTGSNRRMVKPTQMTRRRHHGRFSRAVLKFDIRTSCKPRLRQLSSDRCASRQEQIFATEEDRTQARSRDMMSNVAHDAQRSLTARFGMYWHGLDGSTWPKSNSIISPTFTVTPAGSTTTVWPSHVSVKTSMFAT